MLLFHISPAKNLESILKRGIRLSYSCCTPARLWAVARSKIDWARLHCANRHNVTPFSTIAFPFATRRKEFRFQFPWLWYTTNDLPPERLEQPFFFDYEDFF